MKKTEKLSLSQIYQHTDQVLSDFYENRDSIDGFFDLVEQIVLITKKDFNHNDLSTNGNFPTHLVNVAILSSGIAKYCELAEDEIRKVILGALLHDIGKTYISREILNKPGKLTKQETRIVNKHTSIGRNALVHFTLDSSVLTIVENHHTFIKDLESPINLKNVIKKYKVAYPLICSVADITDAILSERSYKPGLSLDVSRKDLYEKGIMDIRDIYKYLELEY